MNRRAFLTFVGAFAAGAVLPKALLAEKIARAPAWATADMIALYRVSAPLEAGNYTFTGACWKGGKYLGMYVGGVTAIGGETLIEQPVAGMIIKKPKLTLGYVHIPVNIDLTPEVIETLERGEIVQ